MPFALYEKEHVLGGWHRNGSALSQVYVDKTEPDRARSRRTVFPGSAFSVSS